jgi:hypothetical protein
MPLRVVKHVVPLVLPPLQGGKTVRIGKPTHTALLALLLGAIGAPGLKSDDGPYSYLMKIRLGLMSGDLVQTHYDNKVIAYGLEAKRNVHDWFGINGSLFAEVAWEYVPGRHHDVYPWGTFDKDTNTWSNNPLKRLDGSPLFIRHSFDSRKEYGQGINLKVGYAAPMPAFGPAPVSDFLQDVEWFGGLSIDRFKVRSEVKYTLNFQNNQTTVPGTYDGGAFVDETSQISPGVFAGLRYKLKESIGFEISVRNFGMWHLDYTPPAYLIDYINDPSERIKFGDRKFGRESTGTTRGTSIQFAITAKL